MILSQKTGYKWYGEKPFQEWPNYVAPDSRPPRPGSDELLNAPSMHCGKLYPRVREGK